MRRITFMPDHQNPIDGRRAPSAARGERMGAQRVRSPYDRPQRAYALDDIAPERVTFGAEEADFAAKAAGRRGQGRASAAHWDELSRLGDWAQAAAANLDFEDIEDEYEEFGGLTDKTYARLAAAGIPAHIVDRYIEGQEAISAKLRDEMFDLVGGQERFQAMLDWARTALSDEELVAYDEAVNSSPGSAKLAIQGLYQAYVRATGERPQLIGAAGPRAGRGGSNFASTKELVDAIRDPRYKKDPAYRADVESRLARSNIFKR